MRSAARGWRSARGQSLTRPHTALEVTSGAVDWLWQHDVFVIRTELELGESAEVVESLGFEAETTRFGLYRDSSTSNWTSSP